VLALGHERAGRVVLDRLERCSLAAYAAWLQQPGAWVGGFDLPFGLPRELVQTLGWPHRLGGLPDALRQPVARADPRHLRRLLRRPPVGGKFAHRATDGPPAPAPR
jgi:hypothetical protein